MNYRYGWEPLDMYTNAKLVASWDPSQVGVGLSLMVDLVEMILGTENSI